jgi:RNA polymerase sigma-70 factor (ECF subfamily)
VATNAALDELRRRRRRPVAAHPEGPEPVDAGPTIEDRVGARLDVDAALRELPDDFRVVVVLRDLCDLDYAEIAEVLDLPPGTVRSRISRGRALLVERLDPDAAGPSGSGPPRSGPPRSGNCLPSPVRQNDDG